MNLAQRAYVTGVNQGGGNESLRCWRLTPGQLTRSAQGEGMTTPWNRGSGNHFQKLHHGRQNDDCCCCRCCYGCCCCCLVCWHLKNMLVCVKDGSARYVRAATVRQMSLEAHAVPTGPTRRFRERQVRTPFSLWGFFPGRVVPVTERLVHQWLPCRASGAIASAMGRVGPVSVCCR